MTSTTHVEFLRNFNFMNLFSNTKLSEISQILKIKEFSNGNHIYFEEGKVDGVYLVIHG
jgi:signal-transduction protein with cAMP-binding, CBS, and nucleotidyltransferase domain